MLSRDLRSAPLIGLRWGREAQGAETAPVSSGYFSMVSDGRHPRYHSRNGIAESKMKNQRQTIRKIVAYLNNAEEGGGFWLPNIQRPFVWGEDQICKLFDSILREYPISTLLVWKTTSGIRRRKFIDHWRQSLKLSSFYVTEDSKKKCLVLDGQQRLQSLFIGLCGSFEGRELHFDILSGETTFPDDVKYRFRFVESRTAAFPWVKFKDLVHTSLRKRELIEEIIKRSSEPLSNADEDKINDHIDLVDRTFKMEETVTYQELDSIDNPRLYREDDVVEVFIRANSGGTKLGKSDLLFSLLNASWEVADDRMEELLESLNKHGFKFDRDFVLKTCLVLIGQGARYEVEKFRKEGVRESIQENWYEIASAIQCVLDFVRGKTFIQCDKALPTYLVLIPLIFFRYHFPKAWDEANDLDTYLLRCSLAGAFGGQPDNLLDALVKKLEELRFFNLNEVFSVIRNQGRTLEITEDRFWDMGYGSSSVHLLFNWWYRDFNQTPAYDNNLPQIDHVFPKVILSSEKTVNPKTGRHDLLRYRAAEQNQLPNCMLLSREENGAGGKWKTPPAEWFRDKSVEYLQKHLIPRDPSLWEVHRFEDFMAARKALMREHYKTLLMSSTGGRAR
jgi:uncharacterized protein with ParB-like and HNH nuclease domain